MTNMRIWLKMLKTFYRKSVQNVITRASIQVGL